MPSNFPPVPRTKVEVIHFCVIIQALSTRTPLRAVTVATMLTGPAAPADRRSYYGTLYLGLVTVAQNTATSRHSTPVQAVTFCTGSKSRLSSAGLFCLPLTSHNTHSFIIVSGDAHRSRRRSCAIRFKSVSRFVVPGVSRFIAPGSAAIYSTTAHCISMGTVACHAACCISMPSDPTCHNLSIK